jgi:soluble lytic murein transglycosylase-like protein
MTVQRGTTIPYAATNQAPRLLGLGALAVGLFLIFQHGAARHDLAPAALPLATVPALARPVMRQAGPSVFEKEMAMSPQALMTRWDPLIAEASRRFDLPQDWIRAVMRQESGGRTMLDETQRMISSAGAMGIMQVMPQTYAEMRQQYHLGADPYDPRDNVIAGTAYLRWLHGKYGYPAMFAAYNDGPGEFDDHLQKGRKLPAETKNYVQAIGKSLHDPSVGAPELPKAAQLTRPDGTKFDIDITRVSAVRAAIPGEYAPDVQAVVSMGRLQQGVRESVAAATTLLRQHGARI